MMKNVLFIDYPHKGWVDNAILSLQELGELEKLKKKWWEDEDNEEHCEVGCKLFVVSECFPCA